ncbi:MAG: hypothetical protein WC373_16470 [Smithella sp.]|jgi:hypothetical protein
MDKIKEAAIKILEDFITVRSVITLGAFLTAYWLTWHSKPVPDVILRIVDLLLGFWFGTKAAGAIKNGTETKGETK